MTEVIHGLASGMIWSAILGTCLIAIAAVVTATVPASAGAKDSRGNDSRPGRIGDHGDGVHGPSRDIRLNKTPPTAFIPQQSDRNSRNGLRPRPYLPRGSRRSLSLNA